MGALREILAIFDVSVDPKHEVEKGHEKVEGFIGKLEHLGHAVAEAFVFHEAKEFIEGIVDTSSELERMAIKTGVGTTALQELNYAAFQADISSESLGTSLAKLGKGLYEAKNGSAEMAKAFKDAGVEVTDANGNVRSAADAFPDIADAFLRIENPSERAALAMKFFGRSGVELIPLLSKGAEGIEEFRKQAQELGGGLSEEAIKKSVELEEETKKLNFAFTGLKSEVATEVMPVITDLVKGAVELVREFRAWTKDTKIIQAAFVAFGARGVFSLVHHLGGLNGMLKLVKTGFFEVLVPLYALEDFLVFMAGGKSAIGHILEKAFGAGTADKVRAGIQKIFTELTKLVKDNPEIVSAVTAITLAIAGFANAEPAVSGIGKITAALAGGSPFMVAVTAAFAAVMALQAAWKQWEGLKKDLSTGSEKNQDIAAKREAGQDVKDIKELKTHYLFPKLADWFHGRDTSKDVDAAALHANDKFMAKRAEATASMPVPPAAASSTVVHYSPKVQNQITVPPGTPAEVAARVGDAASRGTLRATDLAATKAALVPVTE